MSKNKNIKNKDKNVKSYQNPTKTIWGKVIILILALTMAFGSLISLIYLIATNA